MPHMETVPVRTVPPYEVTIAPGLLDRCGPLLQPILKDCRLAVVTDETVAPLYLDRVVASLEGAGFPVSRHILPAGEKHKTLATLGTLLNDLAAVPLTRSDCVVALGGGVIGDMAGFAAAVYLRGIRCVQMPTTLLSAVDSSVGGKTAVDLPSGKNLVGAFLQPAAVLCDTDALQSLPPELLSDGAAEAIKTAILSDADLFQCVAEGGWTADPVSFIARCVAYKAGVVERDEKESGERKLLNLGHTVGHAIERCSGFSILHGHAVAAGLAIIARAAERLGWTEEPLANRICACLAAHDLPIATNFSAAELAEAALSDKKRAGDRITLVLPQRIGHCTLRSVPVTELPAIISAGLEV